MWSDDHQIETPEQIELSLELAGLGSRFVAQVLDWCLKWGLVIAFGAVAVISVALLGGTLGDLTQPLQYFLMAVTVMVVYAFMLGFDIFYEVYSNGQTPGKQIAGIRVLREGGGAIDFRAACIRNLLGIADLLPTFYFLGAFMILVTKRGQRLGDLAAGTIVVRERTLHAPRELDEIIASLATPEITFTPTQLAACAATDRQVLRSFFQRYQRMDPRPRDQLARRLFRTFMEKTGYESAQPLDRPEDVEPFLASLYRDLVQWAQM